MADKKAEDQKIYVNVEIDKEGRINTAFDGNTLVLFGLLEVARENIMQNLKAAPTAKQDDQG